MTRVVPGFPGKWIPRKYRLPFLHGSQEELGRDVEFVNHALGEELLELRFPGPGAPEDDVSRLEERPHVFESHPVKELSQTLHAKLCRPSQVDRSKEPDVDRHVEGAGI